MNVVFVVSRVWHHKEDSDERDVRAIFSTIEAAKAYVADHVWRIRDYEIYKWHVDSDQDFGEEVF